MTCDVCLLTLPVQDFHADGRYRTGRAPICEQCFVARRRARDLRLSRAARQRDPEGKRQIYRVWHLRTAYGMTLKRFEEILESQGGVCALCLSEHPGPKNWHVDHDHACCPTTPTCGNCSRGLLCSRCNLTLARVEDSPGWLDRARAYLAKPEGYEPANVRAVLESV